MPSHEKNLRTRSAVKTVAEFFALRYTVRDEKRKAINPQKIVCPTNLNFTVIDYEFRHHDALGDAKAVAHIFMAAVERVGLDVEGWLERVRLLVRYWQRMEVFQNEQQNEIRG